MTESEDERSPAGFHEVFDNPDFPCPASDI